MLRRSEFNDIIGIMVRHEDVCDVEVSLLELLVIVDLIQMVWVVCVGALLLEGIGRGIISVVVFVVDLLSSPLVKGIESRRVHVGAIVFA